MHFKYRKNEYELYRSPHCFSLLKKTGVDKTTGEDIYESICYAGNLSTIFKKLFDVHVLDEGEYKSLLECVRTTQKEIRDLLGEGDEL